MRMVLSKLDETLAKDLTPETITSQYKTNNSTDCLTIAGCRFQMSHYSLESVGEDGQQSRFVEYQGCGLTISLDFLLGTVEIY